MKILTKLIMLCICFTVVLNLNAQKKYTKIKYIQMDTRQIGDVGSMSNNQFSMDENGRITAKDGHGIFLDNKTLNAIIADEKVVRDIMKNNSPFGPDILNVDDPSRGGTAGPAGPSNGNPEKTGDEERTIDLGHGMTFTCSSCSGCKANKKEYSKTNIIQCKGSCDSCGPGGTVVQRDKVLGYGTTHGEVIDPHSF